MIWWRVVFKAAKGVEDPRHVDSTVSSSFQLFFFAHASSLPRYFCTLRVEIFGERLWYWMLVLQQYFAFSFLRTPATPLSCRKPSWIDIEGYKVEANPYWLQSVVTKNTHLLLGSRESLWRRWNSRSLDYCVPDLPFLCSYSFCPASLLFDDIASSLK